MLQLPSLVNYLSCPSSFYALSYLDYNTLLRQYEKMEGNPLALFLKKTTHIPNLMVSQFCLSTVTFPLGTSHLRSLLPQRRVFPRTTGIGLLCLKLLMVPLNPG